MWSTLANTIGILGTFIILLSYLLLTHDKLKSDTWTYAGLNLLGSAFLLFSLYFHWNIAAVLMEAVWIIITLLAIYRLTRQSISKKIVSK